MKKVYVIFSEHVDHGTIFTDIIHICATEDLAVEMANAYIGDMIHDALKGPNGKDIINPDLGRYYNAKDLEFGVTYLEFGDINDPYDTYSITIEAAELKEE